MTSLELFYSLIDKKQFSFIKAKEKVFFHLTHREKTEIFSYACYHGNIKIVQFFYHRILFQQEGLFFKKLFIELTEKAYFPDKTVLTWIYHQCKPVILWDNARLFNLARHLDSRLELLNWFLDNKILSRNQINKLLLSLCILKQPKSIIMVLHYPLSSIRLNYLACCLWMLHLNTQNMEPVKEVIEYIDSYQPSFIERLQQVLCEQVIYKPSTWAGVPKTYYIDFHKNSSRADFNFLFRHIRLTRLHDKLVATIDNDKKIDIDDEYPHKI